MDEFLPCPFCVSKRIVVERAGITAEDLDFWFVQCLCCDTKTAAELRTRAEAVKFRNTRKEREVKHEG